VVCRHEQNASFIAAGLGKLTGKTGVCLVSERRLVLVTGEGSHQLTAQEISQFGRRGLKPIVFVLNNSGYLIERLLCKNPDSAYNDLALWHYSELPRALGCDGWFTPASRHVANSIRH
jgi:TPP-dependent 2-oxoacid decarboxylase